jgi:nucleotide-binding universal stress UspA family protein
LAFAVLRAIIPGRQTVAPARDLFRGSLGLRLACNAASFERIDMTFKAMLVHLDDSPWSDGRVEVAVRLAQRFGCALAGVYLRPKAELTPSVAAVLPEQAVEQRLLESGQAQDRAKARFGERARPLGAAEAEFRAPAGDPLDAALAHSRCADLTIVGHAEPSDPSAFFARRLAEHVLLGSGAPMLSLPRSVPAGDLGGHPLIAWDGGREAARAVRDALPMLIRASRVTVVSATREPSGYDDVEQSQGRLVAYLSKHGIDAQSKRVEGAGSELAERLLSQAADVGADLIIMGGYGHARARELVLGGATRSMLRATTVPVFMSH